MKKFVSVIVSMTLLFSLTLNAFAYSTEFSDGDKNTSYSRTAARDYLNQYTVTPNSNYADYTGSGGDCTNFVSQMLRAGGMSMTAKKSSPGNDSWYYYGSAWGNRTSTWTGAHYFRTYWGVINGVGYKHARAMYKYSAAELQNNSAAYRNLVSRCQIGDVIQFVNESGVTYHSMGVQRVYYDNGVRKVTVSQHTSNGYYHLTDKIANKTTGWVVLLKMSTNTASTSAVMLADVLDSEYLSVQNCAESSLEFASSEQLETLVDELQNTSCVTADKDVERWELLEGIGGILDARYNEIIEIEGEDAIPRTVVTKELLINFIQDYVDMCQIVAEIPVDLDPSFVDQEEAVVSLEYEHQYVDEMLSKLIPFLEDAKNNANDENAFEYWETYWDVIREEEMPAYFVEG